MPAEQLVDLLGRDIDPAADNQILAAPDEAIEIAALGDLEQVAGAEPAVVGEGFGGALGGVVIALEQGRPANLQFARHAIFLDRVAAARRDKPAFDIMRTPLAIGALIGAAAREQARALVGIGHVALAGDEAHPLVRPEDVDDDNAELFLKAAHHRGRERRRARGDDAQAGEVNRRQQRLILEQHVEHRRRRDRQARPRDRRDGAAPSFPRSSASTW